MPLTGVAAPGCDADGVTHSHVDLAAPLPIGFAHRGGPQRPAGWRVPDNTLDTFRAALAAGAVGVESDVRLTADGVAVLFHDPTTAAGASVAALRRAELPSYAPSIDEFYDTVADTVEVCLDVLDVGALPRVLEAARRHDALARLWLVKSWPQPRAWRAEIGPHPHLVAGLTWPRSRPGFATVAGAIGASDCCTLNMEDRRWSRGRVAVAHRAGLLTFGWHALTAPQVRRLRLLGADGIYSDTVALLTRFLPHRT